MQLRAPSLARAHVSVLWLGPALACACAPASDDPSVTLRSPLRADFSAVSAVLELRCGTLDCHGAPARNLRIFGVYGLRENGLDVSGGSATTELEVDATYDSVVGLEPEVLSRVTAQKGASAARWIVISKGRNLEAHRGGARLTENSPADICLTSWLAGAVDSAACAADSFGPVPLAGEAW